ncbi:hypothetical protein SPW_7328 [Streptomyces sp. W007]|nr:hypothetical protein SPW_7328 [Streptomyces sp. W007]
MLDALLPPVRLPASAGRGPLMDTPVIIREEPRTNEIVITWDAKTKRARLVHHAGTRSMTLFCEVTDLSDGELSLRISPVPATEDEA